MFGRPIRPKCVRIIEYDVEWVMAMLFADYRHAILGVAKPSEQKATVVQ